MDYRERKDQHSEVKEPDMSRSYTARDYLQWRFEGLYELIRGKVSRMTPAPSSGHQKVSMKLIQLFLKNWKQNSCELFHAPFDIFLVKNGQAWEDTDVVVEPDLCIICDKEKITERGCIGSPDFVLEILSKSSAAKDLREKFEIYQEYQIPEYWIVDPFNQSVIRNILERSRYEIQRTAVKDDIIAPVHFPELELKVSDLFKGLS